MVFELKRKETIPEGVRRIAREQMEKAIELLRNGRKSIRDETVHQARKRFKQIRGALRVVRKELGDKQFDRENGTFRDAGRPLSELRNARIMIDTLDDLTRHYKGGLATGSFKRLRGALKARHRTIRKRVLGKKQTIRSIVMAVRKSSRRVPDWSLAHKGWKAIAPGLRRIYRQGRDAMETAIHEGTDEAFHEWRKRAKDFRYEIELLDRAWPETIQPTAESAHHLTDLLGQDHDLVVLQAIVANEMESAIVDNERESLEPLVSQRRPALKRRGLYASA